MGGSVAVVQRPHNNTEVVVCCRCGDAAYGQQHSMGCKSSTTPYARVQAKTNRRCFKSHIFQNHRRAGAGSL